MRRRPPKSPSSSSMRSDNLSHLEISIPSPAKQATERLHQKEYTVDDFFRCWYDTRDFGALATESPLQSALATLSFQKDDDKMAVIEEALISLANGTRNANAKQIDFDLPISTVAEDNIIHFPDSIANNTIAQILSEDKLKLTPIRDWAVQEVLEFGNDLMLISKNERARAEVDSKAAFDRTRQEYEERLRTASEEVAAARRDLSAAKAINNNSNSSSSSNMQEGESKTKHKFSSGKDLYVADGGKFQPHSSSKAANGAAPKSTAPRPAGGDDDGEPLPPELQHCDKNLVEKILSDIIHTGQVAKHPL